jgi:hypothetical protein
MPPDATISRVKRSPGRVPMLIGGGALACAIAAVLAFAVLGLGDSGTSAAKTSVSSDSARANRHRSGAHGPRHESQLPAVSPADTQVAVVNGTGTAGLAHRLAESLQQNGYSQATALAGVPPGTRQATVVEYRSGHHAEASGVARALSVSHVQPIEGAVSALAGGSTVVVVAGLDKATLPGSTETSSGGSENTGGGTPEGAGTSGTSEHSGTSGASESSGASGTPESAGASGTPESAAGAGASSPPSNEAAP